MFHAFIQSLCHLSDIYWILSYAGYSVVGGGELGVIPTCMAVVFVHPVWNVCSHSVTTTDIRLKKRPAQGSWRGGDNHSQMQAKSLHCTSSETCLLSGFLVSWVSWTISTSCTLNSIWFFLVCSPTYFNCHVYSYLLHETLSPWRIGNGLWVSTLTDTI